jgi:KDO2-lipid IV(A) lauroyltransferase
MRHGTETSGRLTDTRLWRSITMATWHAWQRIDALLPRQARYSFATAVGEVVYWLLPAKRAAVLDNMAHVLGPGASPTAVTLAAKRSFRNYLKYLAEFTHLPRWSDVDLDQLVTGVTGWEHVEDALSDGKGAIFVTPHFGNWDVAGWWFGRRQKFAAVAEPLQPLELDALVQGWRRAKRIGIIPLANGARGALRLLQNGGVVALVVDRPTHALGEGVPVTFFGARTQVPGGAAHFALRTGAPVITGGLWRTPRNTYEVFVWPPMRFAPTGDRERDVQHVMQRIMSEIEKVVRSHPDQWYMFRRMWPTPANLPRPASPASPWPIEVPGSSPSFSAAATGPLTPTP